MNYSEFKILLERYLKRNDLSDMYDDFTTMAEARIHAVMRLPEMEVRSTSTPTAAFWALPDDFIELRHVQATVSGKPRPLEHVTLERADLDRRIMSATGSYAFYSISSTGIEIIPHPTADSTTEVEIIYYAKPTALTTSDGTTNDIVTNYPNLYLYATLGEAALYREADPQAQQWLGSFDAFAAQINNRAEAARYSGNSMQMRTV